MVTAIMDIMCLGYLVFFRWYKGMWRTMSRKAKLRTHILMAVFVVTSIDLVFAVWLLQVPFVANSLRPIVMLLFLSSIRGNMANILLDS